MDSPSVNSVFENKLGDELSENKIPFLRLGTCSLHPVHLEMV